MFGKLLLLLGAVAFSANACSSGSGGGCSGGCRARALAAGRVNGDGELKEGYVYGLGTWVDPKPKSQQTLELVSNPNYLFRSCCEERDLPKACQQRCHFNLFSKELIQSITTGLDECPMSALPEMQFCAAQGRDHTNCCAERGVANTPAGQKCLVFCDQTPDKITPIDYTYLPCFEQFDSMKQCFYSKVSADAKAHFTNDL